MAGSVSELRAKFSATVSGFKQGIGEVRNNLSGISDESKKVTSEASKAFDKLDQNIKGIGDGVNLDNVTNEVKDTTKAVEDMGKTTQQKTAEAQKAWTGLKGTVLKVGGAIAGMGAIMGGAVVGAITVTEDYQKSLNGVQASTGATEEETKKLGDSMKNIYANNYGANFQEIGDTLAYASKTTGAFGEDLEYLAQDSLMLRDTFGYEMTESIRSADKLMRQFGLTSGDAMGIIATGSQKGLDYAQDLLPTIDEYSVYFKQAGFDAEGMFGVFENAKNAGIFNLDYAADGIKEFGIIMTENSERANDALKSIGLTNDKELRAKFAKGGESAREAMATVAKALNDVKDPQLKTIAGVELFGTKFEDMGSTAVMEMFKVNDSIKANTDTLQKINEVKYNTVTEAIQGLGRTLIVDVIEPIQTKVMPSINDFINKVKTNLPAIREAFAQAFDAVINTVNKFKPTFESLFTIFKNVGGWLGSTLVVAFSALGSILAPIVNTVTSLVAKFTEWGAFEPILNGLIAGILAYKTYMFALQVPMLLQLARTKALAIATRLLNMTMAMNPIGLIIALLVGLGVALYTAYKKSETFREIVNGAWKAIKAGAMAVFDWLKTNIPIWIDAFIAGWNNFKTMLSNLWTSIVSGAKAVWSGLVSFFTGIVTGIKNIWSSVTSFFTNLWNSITAFVMPIITAFVNMIKTAFTNFVNNVKYITEPLVNFFINTWNNIKLMVLSIIALFLNLITGNFEGMKISLIGIFTAVKNQIVNIVTTIKDTAIRIFKLLSSGVTGIFNTIKSVVITVAGAIKNGVIKAVTSLKDGAVKGFNALKTGAINTWNALKSGVVNAVTALKNGAINGVNALKTGFTNAVNNIKNAVTNGFNTAKNTASNAITGMRTSVSNGINKIKSFFTDMKSNVISTVKGINLKSIGSDIVQGLINGISGKIKALKNKMKELADSVTGKVKSLLGINSPSRVFREFGGWVGEGLAIGIDKSKKMVAKTTEGLAQSAMIEPDEIGIGSLTGDTLTDQVPDDGTGSGGGGAGVTTNYQAPLMQIENYYDNGETDKREIANGLYRLQVDHDRARGKKT